MQTHEILHIAKLSRLKLSAEEIVAHTERFKKILEMINSIDEINTDGIEPMRHPFDAKIEQSTMREDIPVAVQDRILTTDETPYFYVPKVIE